MPLLQVRLLGGFALLYGEQPVTGVKTPRLQSLLAYLILHRGSQQSRLHVASLYWPDSTEAQARTNLRQLLHYLRQALPDADRFLQVDTHSVTWRTGESMAFDVAQFENLLSQAGEAETRADRLSALRQAVDQYRGDLLPGCYDEWILPLRDRLLDDHIGALRQLTQLLEEQADYALAIQYSRRLLKADPLEENTYRSLMRLYVRTGDRSRALRTYHAAAEILKRDLDVDPEPVTRQFYESLLSADESLQDLPASGRVPLVGRESEWHQLQMAWRTALVGQPHFLVLKGVAGIGKTRVIEQFVSWAEEQRIATATARCYADEDRAAYAPLLEWLRSDLYQGVLRNRDAASRGQLARVLPELDQAEPPAPSSAPSSESWYRQRLFEALTGALLSGGCPLLLVIDDLQWVDGETLALLRYLFRVHRSASFLLVGAVRSEDLEFEEPLSNLLLDLHASAHLTDLELGPLNREQTIVLAQKVAGKPLSDASSGIIYQQSEGYPLFVIEMVRAGLPESLESAAEQSGSLGSTGVPPGSAQFLPARVAAIVERHLRQLSPAARKLAELASVIGRQFTVDLLAQAGDYPEDTVIERLHELWRRRVVREHVDEGYDFSHIKIREVVYAHLNPPQRKLLHQQVARALEALHAGNLDSVSGRIGQHYESAGMPSQAVSWYQHAALGATRIHAHTRVVRILTRVLALLEKMPETAENLREILQTQLALGSSHTLVRGYAAPEVAQAFSSARELYRQVEGSQLDLVAVLWGLHSYHQVRAEFELSQDFADQFLDLAKRLSRPELMQLAYLNLGTIRLQRGQFLSARDLLEQSVAEAVFDRCYPVDTYLGPDPRVFSRCFLAHAQWHLGQPDRALETVREAQALADERCGPFEAVVVLLYSAMLHHFRREVKPAKARTEEALSLCEKYAYKYYEAWATILRGWVQAQEGQVEKGADSMLRGLAGMRATGARVREPYYLGLLAEAKARAGQVDDGLELVAEGLALVDQRGERWCESALYRIRGNLLSRLSDRAEEAESSYLRALEVARDREAGLPELQAAIPLAGRWAAREDQRQQALKLLLETTQRFRSDATWPDLRSARALLRELGHPI